MVAAVSGTLMLDHHRQGQEYIIQEEDTAYDKENHKFQNNVTLATDTVIRLIMNTDTDNDLKEFLSVFDDILFEAMPDKEIERRVQCTQCKYESYFFPREKFQPKNEFKKCTNRTHTWD